MRPFFLFLMTFGMTVLCVAQSPTQFFEQGNAHYANGRFGEAISSYEKVLEAKQESAALYYNLANAHYKLNNIAPSIFYYEKAKQLAPADREIANNAAFAENMKIDTIEPLPENTLKKWANTVLHLLTVDGWAIASVIGLIGFVLLFLGYSFSARTGVKRSFFTAAFTSLALGMISLVFAYSAFAKAEKDNPAIVFTPEVEIKSEPNLASTNAFTLHEGTKVQVLEQQSQWAKIQLIDGKTGWIPYEDIKLLNEF